MYRLAFFRRTVEVEPETLGIERSYRSHKLSYCQQTGIKCLISGYLVAVVLTAPEPLAVETHIPVRQIVVDEVLNGTPRTSRLVVFVVLGDLFYQRVEQRHYPTVYLGTLRERYLLFGGRESVDICIESKKRIGVVQRTEKLTANLFDTFDIEFQVVPRRRIGHHIPAQRVGAEGLYRRERVDGIAETFRHLIAVFIEHKTVGNNVLERHTAFYHRAYGVERKKPTACLVYPLRYEVGGEYFFEIGFIVHFTMKYILNELFIYSTILFFFRLQKALNQ